MKPRNRLYKILLILSSLMVRNSHPAQTFTEKKNAQRVFQAGPETTIEVDNKYGKIHVVSWQKDSVKFLAELVVSSSNLARLQKIKNNIRFNFQSSAWYITATTRFREYG